MEKAMKAQRIPDTDSIEELARFWDTHDLTDFDDQLEEVRTPIFARRKEATVAIALTRKEAATLKRLAEREGVKEAKLVRNWVREKLRTSSSIKPPNKPSQPTAHKTRRG
jgi:CopG antitoxin of type II toxin-antitoxin system